MKIISPANRLLRNPFAKLGVMSAALLLLTVSASAATRTAIAEAEPPSVSSVPSAVPPQPSAAALEALGRHMFFDRNLSASHRMSCATCHDPAFAYGPPNARSVQLGGPELRTQGLRAVPSLRYLQRVPFFSEHYYDEDFDESVDNGPTGGRTWDGRAPTAHDQARIPLLAPQEMANKSTEQAVLAIARSDYADEFRRIFGDRIFDNPEAAFNFAAMALEVFQQSPTDFYPYSSKFDAFLRHQANLSEREIRGLALFNDPAKGSCAHCHPSALGSSGAFPSFTDFGYAAIGVPRNRTLVVNHDPHYYDLGLCGPLRTDLADRPEYCGMFRSPSLRNVGLRHTFFHNGIFHSLDEVLHFYVERDIHPEKWYPRDAQGQVRKYDDLPLEYQNNIDGEPPFDRGPKAQPALSTDEIEDVIAFLWTLTDGWSGAK